MPIQCSSHRRAAFTGGFGSFSAVGSTASVYQSARRHSQGETTAGTGYGVSSPEASATIGGVELGAHAGKMRLGIIVMSSSTFDRAQSGRNIG